MGGHVLVLVSDAYGRECFPYPDRAGAIAAAGRLRAVVIAVGDGVRRDAYSIPVDMLPDGWVVNDLEDDELYALAGDVWFGLDTELR